MSPTGDPAGGAIQFPAMLMFAISASSPNMHAPNNFIPTSN
jgi:hypothetical protein